MNRLLFTALALLWLTARAADTTPMRYSDYPKTTILNPTDLFLTAVPGVTNRSVEARAMVGAIGAQPTNANLTGWSAVPVLDVPRLSQINYFSNYNIFLQAIELDSTLTIAASTALWTTGTVAAGAFVPTSSGRVPVVAKGAVAQSTNLFEAQDSTGAVKASIDANGNSTYNTNTVNVLLLTSPPALDASQMTNGNATTFLSSGAVPVARLSGITTNQMDAGTAAQIALAGTGGGGLSTNWTADVNGAGRSLTNLGSLTVSNLVVSGGTNLTSLSNAVVGGWVKVNGLQTNLSAQTNTVSIGAPNLFGALNGPQTLILTNATTVRNKLYFTAPGDDVNTGYIQYMTGDYFRVAGGLDAEDLVIGTMPDARLSSNVPLKNGTNIFSGTNTFNGVTVMNDNVGIGTTGPTNALSVIGPVLATPTTPTVTPTGTTGTSTWTYKIVAVLSNGRRSPPSVAGTATTGNATLTVGNYNALSWTPYTGAVYYTVYRTASGGTPSDTGLIMTQVGTTFNDTGLLAAGGIDIPTFAENGLITATGLRIGEYAGDQLARVGIQGDMSVNGSIRSTGVDDWKTGSGTELQYIGGAGAIMAFNRDTTHFLPLSLNYGGSAINGPVTIHQGSGDGNHAFIVNGKSLIKSTSGHILELGYGDGTTGGATQYGYFETDSAGRFNISSTAGLVGVGNVAPAYLLDVNGDAQIGAKLRIAMSTTEYDAIYNGGVIYSGGAVGGGVYPFTENGNLIIQSRPTNPRDIVFVNRVAGVQTPVAVFDRNGNVGIGTTVPGNKLSVNGDIGAMTITLTNNPTFQTTNAAPAGYVLGVTLPVVWFAITNAGNKYLIPGFAP